MSYWCCTSRASDVELNRNTNVQYSSIQVHGPSWLERPIAEKRAWKHSLMLLGLSHVPRLWVTVNCYWLWSRRAGVTALLNTNPVLGLLLVSLSRSLSLSPSNSSWEVRCSLYNARFAILLSQETETALWLDTNLRGDAYQLKLGGRMKVGTR